MVSLSMVLYLMALALPRITEESSERQGFLERWAHSEVPEKVDTAFNTFLLKFLRKVKVVVLKLDNTIAKHLQKVKVHEDSKKTAIDFSDITGQNKEGQV